jgi:hypothetical protein
MTNREKFLAGVPFSLGTADVYRTESSEEGHYFIADENLDYYCNAKIEGDVVTFYGLFMGAMQYRKLRFDQIKFIEK